MNRDLISGHSNLIPTACLLYAGIRLMDLYNMLNECEILKKKKDCLLRRWRLWPAWYFLSVQITNKSLKYLNQGDFCSL